MNPRETFFILEITEVQQRRQGDANGEPMAFFSSARGNKEETKERMIVGTLLGRRY